MPRFGHDIQGIAGHWGITYPTGSFFPCPSVGTAQSIGAYLRSWAPIGISVKGAIYRKSDLTLIGVTNEAIVPAYAESVLITFTFPDPKPLLAAEEYLLVVVRSPAAEEYVSLYYDVDATLGKGAHFPITDYSALPASIANIIYYDYGKYSIFCDYTEAGAGTLHVNTTPINGPVFVDGVPQGLAPITLTVPAGSHSVDFGAVAGYTTPSSVRLDIYAGQDGTVNGVYSPITPTMGYLEAHIFVKGIEYVVTIKIDGGASYDVPTANPIALAPGSHTLYVPAYDITRTFEITSGQTTIVKIYYVPTRILSIGSTPQGISFNIVKK